MRLRSLGSVTEMVLTGVRCQKVFGFAFVVVDGVVGRFDVNAGQIVAVDSVEIPVDESECGVAHAGTD